MNNVIENFIILQSFIRKSYLKTYPDVITNKYVLFHTTEREKRKKTCKCTKSSRFLILLHDFSTVA